jgi:hypothetical protein
MCVWLVTLSCGARARFEGDLGPWYSYMFAPLPPPGGTYIGPRPAHTVTVPVFPTL